MSSHTCLFIPIFFRFFIHLSFQVSKVFPLQSLLLLRTQNKLKAVSGYMITMRMWWFCMHLFRLILLFLVDINIEYNCKPNCIIFWEETYVNSFKGNISYLSPFIRSFKGTLYFIHLGYTLSIHSWSFFCLYFGVFLGGIRHRRGS